MTACWVTSWWEKSGACSITRSSHIISTFHYIENICNSTPQPVNSAPTNHFCCWCCKAWKLVITTESVDCCLMTLATLAGVLPCPQYERSCRCLPVNYASRGNNENILTSTFVQEMINSDMISLQLLSSTDSTAEPLSLSAKFVVMLLKPLEMFLYWKAYCESSVLLVCD